MKLLCEILCDHNVSFNIPNLTRMLNSPKCEMQSLLFVTMNFYLQIPLQLHFVSFFMGNLYKMY